MNLTFQFFCRIVLRVQACSIVHDAICIGVQNSRSQLIDDLKKFETCPASGENGYIEICGFGFRCIVFLLGVLYLPSTSKVVKVGLTGLI